MHWIPDTLSPAVLLIPVIAGLVGWFTNWLAIRMMLYPVKFVGIPPYLGWQGVVPSRIDDLSANFSRLISEELLDIGQLVKDIKYDPANSFDPLILRLTDQVEHELATKWASASWDKVNPMVHTQVRFHITKLITSVIDKVFEELQQGTDEYVDLDGLIVRVMRENEGLLGNIMVSIAGPEFRFIERSGWWFGLLFGLVQMGVWVVYPQQWILPAAGFLVGYVTNFLALTLIFQPYKPKRIGPWKLQGVFVARQKEVAAEFSHIFTEQVLTPAVLMDELSDTQRQPAIDKLQSHVDDASSGFLSNPLFGQLLGETRIDKIKEDLMGRLESSKDKTFEEDSHAYTNIQKQTRKVREQMESKLAALSGEAFCGVLRPVFKADEWQLFIVGGALGMIAGGLQAIYLFN